MNLIKFFCYPPPNEVCEGNVFTGVCLSTGGLSVRGGVCLQGVYFQGGSLSWGSLSRGGLCHRDPPYVGRAGGMHPTGMHSCFKSVSLGTHSYDKTCTSLHDFMYTCVTTASSLAQNLEVPGNWYRHKSSSRQFQLCHVREIRQLLGVSRIIFLNRVGSICCTNR